MNMIDRKLKKLSIYKNICSFMLIASLVMSLMGCLNVHGRDVVFQASTFSTFSAGGYDGYLTFRELKKHGDLGIGTVDSLDGEMIGVDGIFYQIKYDGVAYPVDDATKTPFATVTFFEPDQAILLDQPLVYKGLEEYLDRLLPSKDLIYAMKIEGYFSYIKARSIPRQNKPYRLLGEVLKEQSLCEFRDIKGTIVGFRFPDYMKGVNVQGYHFHFITEDRKAGGHLLEVRIEKAKAEIDYTTEFYMMLPDKEWQYAKEIKR